MKLVVACYMWRDPHWRHNNSFTYGPQHVNHLYRMVTKHLSLPHEFVCITDVPPDHSIERGFEPGIRLVPLDTSKHIPNTEFVKLMTFHPRAKELIGEKVLQLDLDTIICGSLDPIVSRDEDLVVWRNPTRIPYDNPIKKGRPYYNGSVILHKCGTMTEIWCAFQPEMAKGVRDTQVWMSHLVGPNAPYWDASDGIYRLARADTPGSGIDGELPDNARIVCFVGSDHKPNRPELREAMPWIKSHWPEGL